MSNEVLTKVGNKAEWAAGGAGGFVVTFTADSDGAIVSDKTYQEIYDAYFTDGKSIRGVMVNGSNDHSLFYLTSVTGDEVCFATVSITVNSATIITLDMIRYTGAVKVGQYVLTT